MIDYGKASFPIEINHCLTNLITFLWVRCILVSLSIRFSLLSSILRRKLGATESLLPPNNIVLYLVSLAISPSSGVLTIRLFVSISYHIGFYLSSIVYFTFILTQKNPVTRMLSGVFLIRILNYFHILFKGYHTIFYLSSIKYKIHRHLL